LLGLIALALASVGMFGVFAYVIRQRTQEIGIRMALGATRGQIVGLVLGASCRSVLYGLVLGLVASTAVSRVMRRLLYGLSGFDLAVYGDVCVILCLAALASRGFRLGPQSE
jgi:ABC-type antimicrobial peptide transport system permease subunit